MSRPEGIANDSVFIDAGQAGGLTHTSAVLEMLEDAEGLLVGESGAEQGDPFALGEPMLAGTAGEHAALLLGAIGEADPEITATAVPIVGALRVLATEEIKIVQENYPQTLGQPMDNAAKRWIMTA